MSVKNKEAKKKALALVIQFMGKASADKMKKKKKPEEEPAEECE